MEKEYVTDQLKYYVDEYKQGNREILADLICYNLDSKSCKTQYRDKALNAIHIEFQKKYSSTLGADEVESIFVDRVVHAFEQIKESNSSPEVLRYFRTVIDSGLKDEIRKQQGEKTFLVNADGEKYEVDVSVDGEFVDVESQYFNPLKDNTIEKDKEKKRIKTKYHHASENDERLDGFSLSDQNIYEKYVTEGEATDYILDFQQDVNVLDILAPVQKQILELYDQGNTKAEIARILGRKSIHTDFENLKEKILTYYNAYLYEKGITSTRLTDEINSFLYHFRLTEKYSKSFDVLGYILNFIHDHYEDEKISFHELHKNKMDNTYTLMYLLDEYVDKKVLPTVIHILNDHSFDPKYTYYIKNGKKTYFKDGQKARIAKHIIIAFEKYISNNNMNRKKIYDYLKMKDSVGCKEKF